MTTRRRFWLWLPLAVSACAHPRPGVPPPATAWLLPKAEDADLAVDPAALTHLLRGLYFLNSDNPGAAVPDLRLALLYAPDSAFIYERLSRAWGAAGERERAESALARGLELHPDDPWLSWLAGELDLERYDYRAAAAHLEIASREDALLLQAGPRLVDALLWQGQSAVAVARAAALQARRPADADLALELAECFEDHGQLDAALSSYRAARQQSPSSRPATVGEMRVLSLLGRPSEAGDALVPLFAFYPDEVGLYVQIARLLARAGRADGEAYRAEALRQTAGDPFGRGVVAAGDLVEGRVAEGVALLRQTAAEFPEILEIRLYLAEVLLAAGDHRGCLEALVLPGSGADPRLFRPRALCYAAAGDLEPALAQIVWAVLATPRPVEPLLDGVRIIAAHAALPAARTRLAALLARVAERLSPVDVALAQTTLADLFGQQDEVRAALQAMPADARQDPDLALKLTDLEARHGALDSAIATLATMVRERPDDPVRLNALGFTLADAGVELDAANVWLRRAHRLAPDEGFIIDSLGWLLYRQGKAAAAVELLLLASRASPADPEILRHLGEAYLAAGQRAPARLALEAANKAGPSPVLRRVIEARLQEVMPP
ncbi:MAG: hypothetical protein HY903_12280 [Deltaproteobacteria bacterium]|nr:hypothetical protein [Deltaproteobacteria bacterium]